jgi:hypothetical protein
MLFHSGSRGKLDSRRRRAGTTTDSVDTRSNGRSAPVIDAAQGSTPHPLSEWSTWNDGEAKKGWLEGVDPFFDTWKHDEQMPFDDAQMVWQETLGRLEEEDVLRDRRQSSPPPSLTPGNARICRR